MARRTPTTATGGEEKLENNAVTPIPTPTLTTIVTIPTSTTTPEDTLHDELKSAIERGKAPWGRCSLVVVGAGREGKTALCNAIAGVPFAPTLSTVEIESFSCSINRMGVQRQGRGMECS